MDLIKNLWRGDVPLREAFWIFGSSVGFLLNISLLYLGSHEEIVTAVPGAFLILLLAIVLYIYSPFILIGIWRSANKYQGLKRYAIAAKIAVILGWANYVRSFEDFFKG